jgi:hypothetical protein
MSDDAYRRRAERGEIRIGTAVLRASYAAVADEVRRGG